jgi:orotate phosphoribosyltransferase
MRQTARPSQSKGWVRDHVKTHGTQKLIEGGLKKGARVLIVEDVITKGSSAVKAVEVVRAFGCEVVRVLALVDRLQGAGELFREKGVADYEAVFTIRAFGVGADVRSERETAARERAGGVEQAGEGRSNLRPVVCRRTWQPVAKG